MIYSEETIPKTAGELRDEIGVAILNVPKGDFPRSPVTGKAYWDTDGIFYSIRRGIENLRRRFGEAKADQLLDMVAQAQAHYGEGHPRLGGPLLQDVQMVVMKRQPWAYPKELYRWPIDLWHPEIKDADLKNGEGKCEPR